MSLFCYPRCVIMDNSGYIVVHPDFLQTNEDNKMFTETHVTTKEPKIAQYLIAQKLMLQQHCLDYEKGEALRFWVV